jgi:hypothetical protein
MTSTDAARDHALAWLTGRLQWEQLLTDLHDRAEATGEPVDLPVQRDTEIPKAA